MDSKTITEIIKLNKNFYKKVAPSFDRSRQNSWSGWELLFSNAQLLKRQKFSVLDLGCGNGRFFNFLVTQVSKSQSPVFSYLGLDSNPYLIERALNEYKDQGARFEKKDVISKNLILTQKFDLVVVFGLTHHIPGIKNRLVWFSSLSTLVNKEGLLALSFWDFKKAVKATSVKSVPSKKIEENDSFLFWKGDLERPRFVHRYSKNELAQVNSILLSGGFTLIKSFSSKDAKKGGNLYYLYEKK